jgi:hypothetical protein
MIKGPYNLPLWQAQFCRQQAHWSGSIMPTTRRYSVLNKTFPESTLICLISCSVRRHLNGELQLPGARLQGLFTLY